MSHNRKWDHESVQQEALKYKKRKDFAMNAAGAYDYARRHKIMNKVCSHMPLLTHGYDDCKVVGCSNHTNGKTFAGYCDWHYKMIKKDHKEKN